MYSNIQKETKNYRNWEEKASAYSILSLIFSIFFLNI